MKIAFLTLGCKVNSYETEKMKQQFEERGHEIAAFQEKADVYVVNTCTVTNIADRKSRKMLRRARNRNPEAVIVAAGCYVDSGGKQDPADGSVDIFLSNKEKLQLVELVEQAWADKQERGAEAVRCGGNMERSITEAARQEEHTRSYLKVQNGCNQYCSYCIIPFVRGPLESRRPEEVLREAASLAQQGYQEVVVTGIHLSSYGVDLEQDTDRITADRFLELEGRPLLQLLSGLNQIEGLARIRLGSLEPRIITPEFAQALFRISKICPHFHLSLQSGSDRVLQRMNRHYTAEEYLEKVELLRRYFDHPAVTTDIIVGFPQETEEEFQETCDFVKKAGFAKIHVFKYSRRRGTAADRMEGQLSQQAKGERSDRLLKLGAELEQHYQSWFAGRTEQVLWEEITEIGDKKYLMGYNERYVRIGMETEGNPEDISLCNTIGNVRIVGQIVPGVLSGDPIERQETINKKK